MYELISELLISRFGVYAEDISPDSTLEQLEVDSLMLAELAVVIEDKLAIRLPQTLPLRLDCTLSEAAAVFEDFLGSRPAATAGK